MFQRTTLVTFAPLAFIDDVIIDVMYLTLCPGPAVLCALEDDRRCHEEVAHSFATLSIHGHPSSRTPAGAAE